jgi:tripartite-type tricarboxylate transporter receptor subunit TctC
MKFLSAVIAGLFAITAHAWEPTKPIESIVGFSAGSGNEISFRIVAAQVEKNNPKTNFIIVNKPGAGSAIANELLTKEPADGYHILLGSDVSLYATDRLSVPNKKFGLDDFAYALSYASVPMTVVTLPADPANNMKDFARITTTEKVSVGDPGAAARLTFELLSQGLKWNVGPAGIARVEYKGPADTLNDVMGGHVRYGIMPLLISYQAHKAGKVKIIGVSSATTPASLPGVSTFASVIPGYEWNLNWSVILPKNTPADIVDWYVREFTRALNTKEVQEKLAENQMFINKSLITPDGLAKHHYAQEKKFKPIVDKVLAEQQK